MAAKRVESFLRTRIIYLVSIKLIYRPMKSIHHILITATLSAGLLLGTLSMTSAQSRDEKRLYELSQRAWQDGLYEVTEINARRLLALGGDSKLAGPARLLLAQALIAQGEGNAAITALQPELAAESQSTLNMTEVRYTLAEGYTLVGKWKEAAALFQEIINNPKAGEFIVRSRYALAWVEYLAGNAEAATGIFTTLGEEFRRQDIGRKSLLTLAKIYIENDRIAEADQTLAPLITDKPRTAQEFEALFWRAQIHTARGELTEALKIYQQITTSDRAQPQSIVGDSWMSIGDLYTAQEKSSDAAKAYEQAYQKSNRINRRTTAMRNYAAAMIANRQITQALEKLREFVQKNQESQIGFEADIVIAEVLYNQKMFTESLAECRRILASLSDTTLDKTKVLELTADNLMLIGESPEALQMLRNSLKNNQNPDEKVRLLFKIADLLLKQKKFDNALETYRQITTELPRSAYAEVALFRQGQTHLLAGNTKSAITAFQSLLTQFPDGAYSDGAQFEIANIYFLSGQFAKAREFYEALPQKFPSSALRAKAQFALAECLFRENKLTEAAASFAQFAQRFPKDALAEQALYNRALALAKPGEETLALEAFNQFIEKYPKSDLAAGATFWLGNYYFNRQDLARAQTLFEQMARNFPKSELLDKAYYWAAKSAAGRQETSKANELYQKVASIPGSSLRTEARLRQAEIQRQLNQFENALLIYESVLKDAGQSPPIEARLGKGICLQFLKKYEEAIKIYEEVLQINPGNLALHNEATYRIGKCQEKLGKNKEALTTYMDIVYAKTLPEKLNKQDAAKIPEFVWFARAGLDAGELKEVEKDWLGAIQIYKILELAGGPYSEQARDRKLKLQSEHFIYDE